MEGKEIAFFAIDDDLYSVLDEIEQMFDIEYVLMGSFEENAPQKYVSYTSIPYLGETNYGSWLSLDHCYMIIPQNASLKIREVEQRKGGVRFLIDLLKNPDSFELSTGGVYTKTKNVIIAGRIATVSTDEFANELYKSLSSKLKKKFKRIGGYYVGPKAEEKLKEGWRLVQFESSPREYDLVYPNK